MRVHAADDRPPLWLPSKAALSKAVGGCQRAAVAGTGYGAQIADLRSSRRNLREIDGGRKIGFQFAESEAREESESREAALFESCDEAMRTIQNCGARRPPASDPQDRFIVLCVML
jgi:hypothetical protein